MRDLVLHVLLWPSDVQRPEHTLGCGEKMLLWLSNIYISIRSYHLHPLPEGSLNSYFLSFSLLKIKSQTKIKQAMSLICYTACDSLNYFSWNHMRPKEK